MLTGFVQWSDLIALLGVIVAALTIVLGIIGKMLSLIHRNDLTHIRQQIETLHSDVQTILTTLGLHVAKHLSSGRDPGGGSE